MITKALLLAAGGGTRIASAVLDRPKPLICIRGKTILEHNLVALAEAGIHTVWVNLHYRADQIEALIGDGRRFGLRVLYSREPSLLGTAGAAKRLESEFHSEPFYVVYGDNMTSVDLRAMAEYHRLTEAVATLAVFDPYDVANTGMAGGRVVLDGRGRILRFEEGQAAQGSYVNAGVYLLDPRVLAFISGEFPTDFGRDVFPSMLASGARLYGYKMSGFCIAVDTPQALANAQALVGVATSGRAP